jgi:hypothetical protein
MADVYRWALQCEELAFCRGQVELRHLGFEPFWGDAVDRARVSIVERLVASDPGVKPVGDIKGAVGADYDIAWTEFSFEFARGFTPEKIRPGEFLFLV